MKRTRLPWKAEKEGELYCYITDAGGKTICHLPSESVRSNRAQYIVCCVNHFDAMREVLKQVNDYFELALQRRPPLNPLRDKIRAALALAQVELDER